MSQKLFIPKKIVVGFQKRDDTFTKKLAYVIYRDDKNVLRKQASWNSWRDQKIEHLELDNNPQDGFTLNKGVQRDRYWGSGRSMVRIYDARDFEFEITINNLMAILMHSDVSKRDILEKCVYAWNGTELVLLPVNSIDYEESSKFTAQQNSKFSAKDLIVGATYTQKNTERSTLVYLGRHDYREQINGYWHSVGEDLVRFDKRRRHVFYDPAGKEFKFKLEPAANIVGVVDDQPHEKLPEYTELLFNSTASHDIVDFGIIPGADEKQTYSNYVYTYTAKYPASDKYPDMDRYVRLHLGHISSYLTKAIEACNEYFAQVMNRHSIKITNQYYNRPLTTGTTHKTVSTAIGQLSNGALETMRQQFAKILLDVLIVDEIAPREGVVKVSHKYGLGLTRNQHTHPEGSSSYYSRAPVDTKKHCYFDATDNEFYKAARQLTLRSVVEAGGPTFLADMFLGLIVVDDAGQYTVDPEKFNAVSTKSAISIFEQLSNTQYYHGEKLLYKIMSPSVKATIKQLLTELANKYNVELGALAGISDCGKKLRLSI